MSKKVTKSKTKTTKNNKFDKEQDGVVTFEWLNGQDEFLKILFLQRVKAGLYHLWRGEYYIDNHNQPILKKDVLKYVRKTKKEIE